MQKVSSWSGDGGPVGFSVEIASLWVRKMSRSCELPGGPGSSGLLLRGNLSSLQRFKSSEVSEERRRFGCLTTGRWLSLGVRAGRGLRFPFRLQCLHFRAPQGVQPSPPHCDTRVIGFRVQPETT